MHYNTLHRFVCSACRRCYPTQHLLDLHLVEWHDAMFELKSASKKMVRFMKQHYFTTDVARSCISRLEIRSMERGICPIAPLVLHLTFIR